MFESILGLGGNSGMISGSSGSFDFDVVTIESHESTLRVTENPIETGSNISDHAVLEPKEIVINGVMVAYNRPPKLSSKTLGFDFPEFPLPFDVLPVVDKALDVANDFASSLMSGGVGQTINIAAEFLPNFQTPLADFSGGDRVRNAFDNLLSLQRSGDPVTLTTHSKQYENMMITSIVFDQDKEFSGEFSITLREIFIVESKIGAGLVVEGSNMPKQVSKGNAGTTQPKKTEPSQSLLSRGLGGS